MKRGAVVEDWISSLDEERSGCLDEETGSMKRCAVVLMKTGVVSMERGVVVLTKTGVVSMERGAVVLTKTGEVER